GARMRRRLLLLDGFAFGERGLDVLERQRELIGGKPCQPLARGGKALRLAQQLAKPLVHRHQLVAFGKHGERKGAEAFKVLGEPISRPIHVPSMSQRSPFASFNVVPDSLHRSYCTASGVLIRRACTRVQSSPSISADSCAGVSRITPSS